MIKLFWISLFLFTNLIFNLNIFSQKIIEGYHSNAELINELNLIQNKCGKKISRISELGKSTSGEFPILLFSIRSEKIKSRIENISNIFGYEAKSPAMLILAGADGELLAGTELILHWLEGICIKINAKDSMTLDLIEYFDIYIIPRLNPEGADKTLFGKGRSFSGTSSKSDADNDGRYNEDSPADINGDNLIQSLRIEDIHGKWQASQAFSDLLIEADEKKTDGTKYILLFEGKDNDGDLLVNEDHTYYSVPAYNFPTGQKFGTARTGLYPTSIAESKALVQFVSTHPEIILSLDLGSLRDNLISAPKNLMPPEGANKTLLAERFKLDKMFYQKFSDDFHKILPQKYVAPSVNSLDSWFSYSYYTAGILSLTTPAWTIASGESTKKDLRIDIPEPTSGNGIDKSGKISGVPNNSDGDEITPHEKPCGKLSYIESLYQYHLSKNPSICHGWERVSHPDFAGKVVDMGGIQPVHLFNPPISEIDHLLLGWDKVISDIISQAPELVIKDIFLKKTARQVFHVTAQVQNTGKMPYQAGLGTLARQNYPIRLKLILPPKGKLLAGKVLSLYQNILPNEILEESWIIQLPFSANHVSVAVSGGRGGYSLLNYDIDKMSYSK